MRLTWRRIGGEELASGLTEGQYAVSDDGSMVAYQTDGNEDEATEITVKNLEDGAEYNISCAENECIKPLDFIYSDFVVGTARKWMMQVRPLQESRYCRCIR